MSLDGSEPSVAEIEAVIQPLERRGPDGTQHWRDGPTALGHTLLATTPESLVEVLPLTDPASGCTITADVRLDNREELIIALDLSAETRTIGDGELILRAYLNWGESCPAFLLGDFAFAIWDPRSAQLFCARDHMGMRQLNYYYDPGHVFVLATEPKAILAHDRVPLSINEGRIADFIDNLEGVDLTSTFFEGILRLPPAHCLTVSDQRLSRSKFWELRPQPELKLGSDKAYADAFLEVFTEAVRCRLRSPGPVGSMLSGGMDSGSIVAVASTLLAADGKGPLPTFSAVGPDPESCIETRAIHDALTMPGLAPTLIDHEELEAYADDILSLTISSDEPFDGHMALPRAVYLAARQAGIKVVLDGVAGDIVLSSSSYVATLLRRGRLFRALSEARGERQFWGCHQSAWGILVRSAWRAFAPRQVRAAKRYLSSRINDITTKEITTINLDFAEKINICGKRDLARRQIASDDRLDDCERARKVQHPDLVVGRERYDRVAAALAIEPRDPFIDLRVIRFCLSLPYSQLQVEGWPKAVLRNAMKGKLPYSVIWRRGKDHLGWAFSKTLFSKLATTLLFSDKIVQLLESFIDLDRVRASDRYSIKSDELAESMETFYLFHWLDQLTRVQSSLPRMSEGVAREGPGKQRENRPIFSP